MIDFIYDTWKDALSDCISEAMADCRTGPYNPDSPEPDVILEDAFGDVEKKTILYTQDIPGLYIFYFRPKKLWRSFLKFLKSRI